VSGRSLENYTPEERGKLLDWIDQAEDILAAKKAELRSIIEADPEAVTGWKLKDGRKIRKVTNTGAAWSAIENSFGLTLDEFLSFCEVSPAKLEEFVYDDIKASGNKETRKQVKESVEAALGDLVEVKQAQQSLVKI